MVPVCVNQAMNQDWYTKLDDYGTVTVRYGLDMVTGTVRKHTLRTVAKHGTLRYDRKVNICIVHIRLYSLTNTVMMMMMMIDSLD